VPPQNEGTVAKDGAIGDEIEMGMAMGMLP
jgi:hypothetical protein